MTESLTFAEERDLLKPTEDLALEVIAARYRLGEAIWTFSSIHSKTLANLQSRGLVFVIHGVTEGTLRAGLTDKGRERVLMGGYVPPLDADLAAARRENATLRQALERIAWSGAWSEKSDIARAALAASPAEVPQP